MTKILECSHENALSAVGRVDSFAQRLRVRGAECTKAPKSEWMSESAMKQRIADEGYVVEKFKTTDGNCYEIYGKDKDGKKVEIYFNPIDGTIVKEKRG